VEQIKEKLIDNFHRITLETYRIRESELLRIIVLIGMPIYGYLWLLIKLINHSIKIDSYWFVILTIACTILLAFGAVYLIVLSYNYRNLQYALSKIEKEYTIEKILPPEWNIINNIDKMKWLDFLPELYKCIFYFDIVVIIGIMILGVIGPLGVYKKDSIYYFLIFLGLEFFIIFFIYKKYFQKIKCRIKTL